MTEFPALRESLLRAAARRRRRRLTVRAAVPAFAVGAAAVALFVVPGGAGDREREVATPPARTPLEEAFAIFRRPATAADRPSSVKIDPKTGAIIPDGTAGFDTSRLLGVVGERRVYAMAGTRRGVETVCLVEPGRGSACSPLAGGTPISSFGTGVYAQLFRDGTRDVRLTLQDGSRLAPRLRDGGLVVAAKHVGIVSWTAADGVRHVSRNIWAPQPPAPPETCPRALRATPTRAQAARAAMLAVQDLYPAARSARVTAVGPPAEAFCSSAVTARTLQVDLRLDTGRKRDSLAQGRLLVGNVGGHVQVYYFMH
jgi:hypothetical protein